MPNIDLWDSLEKTDPAHTKTFSGRGGFSGTAINGTYVLKRLTEAFGPCGRGWKFVVDKESVEEGHTLASGDKCKLHVIRGHIEYRQDDVWWTTGSQFGQTILVGENKYGPFTDEDAPKKSITDCISKCAVMLGIGADVHLGLFDDNKYVNQRREEEAAERPTSPAKPTTSPAVSAAIRAGKIDAAKSAAIKFAQDCSEFFVKCPTFGALQTWKAHKDSHGTTNMEKMEKLKSYDEDLYATAMVELNDATARLIGA